MGRAVEATRTPRKQSTPERLTEIVAGLADSGTLEATLRVPDAVGELRIRADLRSRQTFTSVIVDAPREGRVRSRITWLLRQLDNAPPTLVIEARYPYNGTVPAAVIQAQENPDVLLNPQDPRREPKLFVLTLNRPMGQKRGRSEGSFVRDTSAQTIAFYRDFVQNLKAWQAPAPKIKPAVKPPLPPDDEEPILNAWGDEPTASLSVPAEAPDGPATGTAPPEA